MAKKHRTSEEAQRDALEAKRRFDAGENLGDVLKDIKMSSMVYYRNIKGQKKAKRAYKKRDKKAGMYLRAEKKPKVSFEEISQVKKGKTMIIVTDDDATVSNIMLAAFGNRGV